MQFSTARSAWAAAVAAVSLLSGADAGERRPFTVDDLLALEHVDEWCDGGVALSGDGASVAVARAQREINVWAQRGAGQPFEKITDAQSGLAQWICPEWSAKGGALAFVRRSPEDATVWVWEGAGRGLRRAGTRALAGGMDASYQFQWIDDHSLVYAGAARSAGHAPSAIDRSSVSDLDLARIIQRGDTVTANVLESGASEVLESRPQAELVLWDRVTAREKVLMRGLIRSWSLAPRGGVLAVLRKSSIRHPRETRPLRGPPSRLRVEVVTLSGETMRFTGAPPALDVVESSLAWSPTGEQLAFVGYEADNFERPILYRLDLRSRRASASELREMTVSTRPSGHVDLQWAASGRLLLRAVKAGRWDWFLIGRDGGVRCSTCRMANAPEALWRERHRNSFVGVADGALWRVDPESGVSRNLTRGIDARFSRIAWPAASASRTCGDDACRGYSQLILGGDGAGAHYLVHLNPFSLTRIAQPAEDATLLAYSPISDDALFMASGNSGSRMWRGRVGSGEFHEVYSANQFLGEIEPGRARLIEYTTAKGQQLQGWLLLPPGFSEARRYPLITWVYAGETARATPPRAFDLDTADDVNLQVAAGRGFAVLVPSMPLGPRGTPDDPYEHLTEGVLPAVDEAIELGVADPDRLFLAGHSFGGFSVYGLVTQTDRFAAAMAASGMTNFTSHYLQFDGLTRHTDYPHESHHHLGITERGQANFVAPLWGDVDRYVRNSPVFKADRVHTPLLIMHGDADYVDMEQAEEFFSALYRQGKRARFVRYWGERHKFESAANIRDFWERTLDWFDEHSLAATDVSATRGTGAAQ